ncbi:hypothetical protein SERLADRAFT_469284 [Serpula lacrymans var. lacrymans S7.9]|uniref:coproporphyrinogen oxidase n=1 Tax=Serpula lacrymans var. lacrymans (strain S7.9) TaxID=578457 RepID=F8NZX6_SERL9|nr:uncharacterized protein SERLADRAFT_469284 [Serpula lacrymans var. lacrymans S7.9]EGO23403.1 hypothetical protein SERLADRAFT_469284 [Serpula lacrymans var. lacrymans S7.9]
MATSESSIPETMRKKVETYIFALQDEIVSAFEKIDPNAPPFKRDSWVRAHGSGGKGMSCVFSAPSPDPTSSPSAQEPNTVLEKAGVNISVVHGMLPPPAIKQMRADHSSIPYDGTSSLPFFAAGISLVVHPRNPNAPTVHANYRYFEITEPVTEGSVDPGKVVAWWFGGGSDLTPSYLYEEDAIHFHSTIKNACNQHGSELYPTFKKCATNTFTYLIGGKLEELADYFLTTSVAKSIHDSQMMFPGLNRPRTFLRSFRLWATLLSPLTSLSWNVG